MRTTIKTILLIAVLALLTASCSTSESAGAAAAVASTTILNTTTTVPPPDPAERAAATQEANIEAFLAQDMEAMMATQSEDAEFINRSMNTHWVGASQIQVGMRTVFEITDPVVTEVFDSFVSDDGSRGVVVWHWVGENGMGNPIDLIQVQLLEYADGLITETTSYWESMDVHDQLTAGYGSSG